MSSTATTLYLLKIVIPINMAREYLGFSQVGLLVPKSDCGNLPTFVPGLSQFFFSFSREPLLPKSCRCFSFKSLVSSGWIPSSFLSLLFTSLLLSNYAHQHFLLHVFHSWVLNQREISGGGYGNLIVEGFIFFTHVFDCVGKQLPQFLFLPTIRRVKLSKLLSLLGQKTESQPPSMVSYSLS